MTTRLRVLLGFAIALSVSFAARGDDVPCPVTSINVVTVPSLPDPWHWSESQPWENPYRKFRLLQGKEMVVCTFQGNQLVDDPPSSSFNGATPIGAEYFVLVARRPVTEGVPPGSYSCPFNSFQTKIATPLPAPWTGVTYSFTLHEKRFRGDGVFCAYKGPDRNTTPTTPATIVRPLRLDYPNLTENPKPPTPVLGLTQAFAVNFIKLTTLSPAPHASVPCPAKVLMHGQIDANGPGLVRYRLIHNGTAEPVQSMNFSEAGSKTKSFELTVAAKPPAANPGGTLAQKPPPAPGVNEGLAHIEIVEPLAGKKVSNDASYSLKCQPTAPGGLAIPAAKPPGGG